MSQSTTSWSRIGRRFWTTCAGVALVVAGACNVSLVRFDAPATVFVGAAFDVIVSGSGTNGAPNDQVGVVLQVPFSFVVEGSTVIEGAALAATNPPNFTGLFTAEPGTSLVFVSGTAATSATRGAVRFRLRAPRTPGAYTIKVALAATSGGVWIVNAPASGGNFALISGAPHARTVVVSALPTGTPSWRLASTGLFATTATGYVPFEYDVAIGDFDADSRTEIVAGEPQPGVSFIASPSPARLYKGRVVESWTSNQPFGGLVMTRGAATGDFNGDGVDDLMLDARPHLGLAGGGFLVLPSLDPTAPAVVTTAVADFNQDGLDDVVLYDGGISVFMATGAGAFALQSAGLPASGATDFADILTADIDADGDLDLVALRRQSIETYLNIGAAGFAAGPNGPAVNSPLAYRFAAAGDLDGDGDADLVVGVDGGQPASGFTQAYSATAFICRKDANGWTPVLASGLPLAESYGAATIADVDVDGSRDVLLARTIDGPTNDEWGRIELWRNAGSLAFTRLTALETGLHIGGLGNVFTIVHRDVDHDGLADIVANGAQGTSVYLRSSPAQSTTVSNVGQSLGQSVDVLFVNGSARDALTQAVEVGLSQPLAIALAQSPFAVLPSRYVIFGKLGWPVAGEALTTVIGDLPFPPPLLQPGNPLLFTLANSFAPDATAALPPAFPGAFSFTLPAGLPLAIVFSLCAVIDDPASPPFAIARTNTVIVDVR